MFCSNVAYSEKIGESSTAPSNPCMYGRSWLVCTVGQWTSWRCWRLPPAARTHTDSPCPCSYQIDQRLNLGPNFPRAHEYFTDDKVNHSQQVLFAKRRYNHVSVWNCHLCINGLCRLRWTGSVNGSGLRGVLGIPPNPFTSKGSPSMRIYEWTEQNESAALWWNSVSLFEGLIRTRKEKAAVQEVFKSKM